MAYQTSTNQYQSTLYIVDNTGNSPYTTIQSAIDAANTAGQPATISVRAGTYTEDLTLYDGITIRGYTNAETVITGVHTPPDSGNIKFCDIGLASPTDIVASGAAGTTTIEIENCNFNCTNGYICDLPAWTGDINIDSSTDASTINGIFNNAGTATLTIENSILGVTATNTLTMDGQLVIYNTVIGCPMALSGNAVSEIDSGCIILDTLTISGDVNLTIGNSRFNTGANTAFSTTSSVTAVLANVSINSANAAAIGGTGTVQFVAVSYEDEFANAGTVGSDLTGTFRAGTILAPTFDTNVAAAGVTLSGTSLLADGTDANIDINITSKGTGTVIINELTLTTDLAVTEGGTGAGTFTDHGVLVGSGVDAFTPLVVGTDGQILLGDSADDPVFGTITSTDGTITFTPGPGSLVIEGTDATETQDGVVELATDAEAIDGTDSVRAIVPTSLKAKLGTQTSHGIPYGAGTTGAVAWTAEPSDGQLVIGSTGNIPVLATLTGGDHIDITSTAGSILIEGSHVVDAFTGFDVWDAGGPYFDDSVLGDFDLLVAGSGYIQGIEVSWTAPQTVTGMTSGNTYYIYIDSSGDIQKTDTRTEALFEDNIVLFECLRDTTTGTNLQLTVKENHPYKMPPVTSNYLHAVVGTVISNANNGANITLNGTQKIEITGDDKLEDHGLETDISDSGGVALTWEQYYTTAGGKWARHTSSDTFNGFYNNAGSPTALGSNKFGVYTLYISKDDLNTATPVCFAVLNSAQYNNHGAADTAIANGATSIATAELEALEIAQLGYIIYSESATAIIDVIISKETLRSTLSTSGTNLASLTLTEVANFDGILSAADTTVQVALDTIDDWGGGATDHAVMLGSGDNSPLSATAVGTDGQILIGDSADNPVFANIGSTDGTITITEGAGTLVLEGTDATTAQDGVVELTTDAEAIAGADTARAVTAAALKAKLGAQTDHGLPYGATDSVAIAWTAEPSDGQLLIGSTGNIPQLATLTAGTNVTIDNAANSITINASGGGGGGGLSWAVVTGTSQSMAIDSGYITNNVALVTCTLPSTAVIGATIKVTGLGAGGWKIAQNAGETIYFGSGSTTTGTGGYLASTAVRDSVELICVVADNDWNIVSSLGNIELG